MAGVGTSMPIPLAAVSIGAAVLLAAVHAGHAQTPADTITDPRDGYRYPVVAIGDLRWFAENLRFRTGDSRCYENDEANCEDHGRLYRLDDALKACPAGWRVPSEADWPTALGRWGAMLPTGPRPWARPTTCPRPHGIGTWPPTGTRSGGRRST